MSLFPLSMRRARAGSNRYLGASISVLALLVSACAQGPIGANYGFDPTTVPRVGESSATAHLLAPLARGVSAAAGKSTRDFRIRGAVAKTGRSGAKTDKIGTIRANEPVPGVFGSVQVRRNDTSAFTSVRSALDGTYRELDNAASCRSNYWTKCPVAEWRAFLRKIDGKDRKSQLRAVNRYVNRARYVSDQRNYGVADLWATAGQLFRRGGDCEDYVIAKYVSLRTLGVPVDNMRMAVVYDRARRIGHAVLLVDIGSETLVLDNQSPYVLPAERVTTYQAIYSLNEHNWWIHQTSQRAAATPPSREDDGGRG